MDKFGDLQACLKKGVDGISDGVQKLADQERERRRLEEQRRREDGERSRREKEEYLRIVRETIREEVRPRFDRALRNLEAQNESLRSAALHPGVEATRTMTARSELAPIGSYSTNRQLTASEDSPHRQSSPECIAHGRTPIRNISSHAQELPTQRGQRDGAPSPDQEHPTRVQRTTALRTFQIRPLDDEEVVESGPPSPAPKAPAKRKGRQAAKPAASAKCAAPKKYGRSAQKRAREEEAEASAGPASPSALRPDPRSEQRTSTATNRPQVVHPLDRGDQADALQFDAERSPSPYWEDIPQPAPRRRLMTEVANLGLQHEPVANEADDADRGTKKRRAVQAEGRATHVDAPRQLRPRNRSVRYY